MTCSPTFIVVATSTEMANGNASADFRIAVVVLDDLAVVEVTSGENVIDVVVGGTVVLVVVVVITVVGVVAVASCFSGLAATAAQPPSESTIAREIPPPIARVLCCMQELWRS